MANTLKQMGNEASAKKIENIQRNHLEVLELKATIVFFFKLSQYRLNSRIEMTEKIFNVLQCTIDA